jgi:TetR/AcrR family fatty acid metabolism transcriptional regulator
VSGSASRRRSVRESVREETREAYREAILSAAERVFVRAGFYETRMADVAREAGVGVGTLYNYFESKEEIFGAMLDAQHEQFWRGLTRSIEGDDDAMARLRHLVVTTFEHLEQHGALFAIFTERGGVGEFDVERIAGVSVARRYEQFLDLLERTIRAAVKSKQIRADIDARLLASVLSGSMNAATYSWLKRGRRGHLSSTADELLSLFLQGARAS